MTNALYPPCPGCGQHHPVVAVCDYIAVQVPPSTTIPEVRQMLAEGKILSRRAAIHRGLLKVTAG